MSEDKQSKDLWLALLSPAVSSVTFSWEVTSQLNLLVGDYNRDSVNCQIYSVWYNLINFPQLLPRAKRLDLFSNSTPVICGKSSTPSGSQWLCLVLFVSAKSQKSSLQEPLNQGVFHSMNCVGLFAHCKWLQATRSVTWMSSSYGCSQPSLQRKMNWNWRITGTSDIPLIQIPMYQCGEAHTCVGIPRHQKKLDV